MSNYKVICGTGHRPDKLGGYDNHESTIAMVQVAVEYLEEFKPEMVIVGMAQGWDMALAEACFKTGTKYICAIPCNGQESKWSNKSKTIYSFLLSQAHSICYISEDYTAWCMQKRNEFMVDNSQAILCLWDGTEGGTNNTLKYAKKQNKQYINLYEKWKVKYENLKTGR